MQRTGGHRQVLDHELPLCGARQSLLAPIEDVALTFSSQQIALLHYRAVAAGFYQPRNQPERVASELNRDSDEPNARNR